MNWPWPKNALKEALHNQERGAQPSKNQSKYGCCNAKRKALQKFTDLGRAQGRRRLSITKNRTCGWSTKPKSSQLRSNRKSHEHAFGTSRLGLTAGTGLASLPYLDNTLKTLRRMSQITCACLSVRCRKLTALIRNISSAVFPHHDPKNVASESIRGLRSNLLFLGPLKAPTSSP